MTGSVKQDEKLASAGYERRLRWWQDASWIDGLVAGVSLRLVGRERWSAGLKLESETRVRYSSQSAKLELGFNF